MSEISCLSPYNKIFSNHFSILKYPRRITKGNFQYPLKEFLFLTISSIISDWEDIIYFWRKEIKLVAKVLFL